MTGTVVGNRLDRRKARTRAALVTAARDLLAIRDPAAVSIQEITDAADVGFGSFHNHFTSKQELFDCAVAESAQEHWALLEGVTAGLADPAEVFAVAARVTALLPRTRPALARVIDRTGTRYLDVAPVLATRMLTHLRHAKAVGRFCFDDPVIALATAGGAVLGVLHLNLTTVPAATGTAAGREDAGPERSAEALALSLLRMFGVPEGDARRLSTRPLPPVGQGWL